MAVTVCIYFRFRQVLFRYVRVIAYVFCHAGVLVCLFVVTVADFWYDVIKIGYNTIGYRILNCIVNLAFLIFGFYLSLGIPQLFSKSFFVAVIVLSTHSYLEFICVGCYCDRFLFVGRVQQTLRKLGRCQMTQLI